MKQRYDVIVIGSGIGGLTAALSCARAKRSVLVLEAGKQFGGYTNPFARKHFHFDPGIHYIGECGPGQSFRRMLDKLGLEHVGFSELDPDGFDHYVFPGYDVKNCRGLERFRDRLAADFPSERRGLDRFFRLLADVDVVSKAPSKAKSARGLLQVLKSAPSLLRYSRATLSEVLDHHFDDLRLKAALSGPCGDLGLPPSRVSALMHMAVLTHYAGGAYFPKGGSAGLRDGFVDGLRQEGAVLKRNSRVASILHDGELVYGVRTVEGDTYHGSAVISNAQAHVTYEMLGRDHIPRRLQRKLDNTEQSYGSLTIYLGVDGELDTSAVGSANIWSYDSLDIDEMYSAEALREFTKAGSFFLTVPTNKDPDGGLAPEGKQTVEMVTLCHGAPFAKWFDKKTMRRGREYEALKNDIADHYLELAERHLPGLRDHIIVQEVGTPATNKSFAFSPEGNIYGPAHTPAQSVPFRFATQAPIAGLTLCGASVISAGIVPCATSGRIAAKATLSQLETRRKSFVIPSVRKLRAALG